MHLFSSVKRKLPELLKRTTNGTNIICAQLLLSSFRKTAVLWDS